MRDVGDVSVTLVVSGGEGDSDCVDDVSPGGGKGRPPVSVVERILVIVGREVGRETLSVKDEEGDAAGGGRVVVDDDVVVSGGDEDDS